MNGFQKSAHANQEINGRQLAFIAAIFLPTAKFLEAPSILATYAKGDLLLPALLHFLLQGLLLAALLFASSRSEEPLFSRLENRLKWGAKIVYALLAVYFVFATILPLLDLDKFTYAVFFDTSPTVFSFALFFVLSAFLCSKGLKSIGRSADVSLFLFAVPFLALIGMSLVETDFSHLLPLFGSKFGDTVYAFKRSTPHFSDAILLLPLLARRRYEKGDGVKIMSGYAVGAVATLLFLAVFFGVYSSIAPREHYAFSKIAQYFPALSTIGRLDLIFVYLLTIVLIFYTCLPLQHTVQCAALLLKKKETWLFSAVLNLLLFVFLLFFNKYYNAIYTLISSHLTPIFYFIADLLPLFFLFIPKTPIKNKEKRYA